VILVQCQFKDNNDRNITAYNLVMYNNSVLKVELWKPKNNVITLNKGESDRLYM